MTAPLLSRLCWSHYSQLPFMLFAQRITRNLCIRDQKLAVSFVFFCLFAFNWIWMSLLEDRVALEAMWEGGMPHFAVRWWGMSLEDCPKDWELVPGLILYLHWFTIFTPAVTPCLIYLLGVLPHDDCILLSDSSASHDHFLYCLCHKENWELLFMVLLCPHHFFKKCWEWCFYLIFISQLKFPTPLIYKDTKW